MKTIKLLTLILSIILFVIQPVNAQELITNEIDEFTGNRVVQSSYELIEHKGFSGETYVSAFYNEGEYFLILNVLSLDNWELLSSTVNANFIIDDTRRTYELIEVKSEIVQDIRDERYAIVLSSREFETFSNADDLRFRANGNIYTITKTVKDSFGLVLSELR